MLYHHAPYPVIPDALVKKYTIEVELLLASHAVLCDFKTLFRNGACGAKMFDAYFIKMFLWIPAEGQDMHSLHLKALAWSKTYRV